MTAENRLSPLARRFLLAFGLVAIVAVALVTAAALVGTDRGLSSQGEAEREDVAERVAGIVANGYERSGGWQEADLARAETAAEAAGAVLVVRDAGGQPVWSGRTDDGARHGMGPGMGPGMGQGTGLGMGTPVTADVTVDGATVGEVRLGFGHAASSGRPVAWAWILGAAAAAVLLALVAAWFVTRQLTRPLAALTSATRAFAAGDREALVPVRGAGELAELADAFEDAVTAVRRAEHSREQMAADVAHELRTPLAALQAGLEELRDGLAEPDPERLGRLHDQSLRVGRVVGDLDALFAAESPTRAVRRDRVDLAEVVRTEVAAREPQLRAADLRVTLDATAGPLWVAGDGERLHQVLGNLLENCVRHCRAGDEVRVSVGSAAGKARLLVEDTGPGIAHADQAAVFDRFWRGPRQDGRPGSGLGLAVVRSLVAAHGGTVSVRSDGVTGSTFTVDLPVLAEAR